MEDNANVEPPFLAMKRSNWNYAAMNFERQLLDAQSVLEKGWFSNVIYGPTRSSGKELSYFPAIVGAMDAGQRDTAQKAIAEIAQILERASHSLGF